MDNGEKHRSLYLTIGLTAAFLILAAQLFRLQILDNSFKVSAQNNALYYQTRYPARGLILDRNGKVLVGNKNTYDILVTPHYVKDFDTAALCALLDLDIETVRDKFKEYRRYRTRIGYRTITFVSQVSQEQYSRFLEKSHKFPEFRGVPRTTRMYPYNAGGNLLGYVTEVDQNFLDKHPDYEMGDYTGRTGLEETCESMLKGGKGYSIYLRDANNRIQSSYRDGAFDKPAMPGRDVVSTIDAELQKYGEELMRNKVGSVIAIEPSTGEILSMISSPGIDVSVLGEINKHYSRIASDPFTPMFNRAVMSPQPPGSVFKLVNALIGLQEGVVSTGTEFPCHNGYTARGISVGCHPHKSPLNFTEAIMASCNSYFCYLFRNILENSEYGSTAKAFDSWAGYVRSFGFGTRLGSDFPSEIAGIVPSSKTYDRIYGQNSWNALSVISLSIGQGELGCTPLHLANLAATIANRGWYRIPHIVRRHENDSIDAKFREKHYTLVDTCHFEDVIEGMYQAVNAPAGQGATARIAAVKDLDICGKTGTAENPHGDEHAVFVCFAPRESPRIAIAVYIENAGFGATWAAPVASLMVEKYLSGEISPSRKWLEQNMKEANLLNKVPASPDYVPPKKDKK
ncbi:MAG TPA: penicillin-binding protein 2 [Candidatus Coprenecus stercoravium]|uniref:Penicillin-binding protein 2 n=1 Tax=Candidatus Coprenecus stercoravium TaxID=2840735 RepID=A0A9D2GQS1_9BACT|nr:penicillin-binding protein 2 [Candidatus Coprenecus stercoravium]